MTSSRVESLERSLRDLGSVLVAFSGGVDSSLLLYMARNVLGERAVAVTVLSQLTTPADRERAGRAARAIGARHLFLETDLLALPQIASNPAQRCYHCKKAVFGLLREKAGELGLAWVVDACQADDASEYRPGMLAAVELGVRSPLAECGLGKEEVRRYAGIFGLPTADEPSSPCLATRIPFGIPITVAALERVAAAEEALRRRGFRVFRVRDRHPVAVLEVPDAEISRLAAWPLRRDITREFKELGYHYVALDLEGFRSGSLAEVLTPLEKKKPIL